MITEDQIEQLAEKITTGEGIGQYMDKPPRIAHFILGYKAANNNKWISVKDRLPDDLNYHIATWSLPSPDGARLIEGSRSAMCEIYKDGHWYGENGIKLNAITHWMPFPTPPKKDNL